MPKFETFNNTPDTGIFYISSNYFFQLFESYSKCYNIPDSSVIEFLLKFNMDILKKKYFMFKLIVKENSLVQINLTNYKFDEKGKIIFNYYEPQIRMRPYVSEEINKKIPPGVYFIEWKYTKNEEPEEILFWICYKGNIELDYLGMYNFSQVDNYNDDSEFYFCSNEGLIMKKEAYKFSEKLGIYHERKGNLHAFIEKTLHLNINGDEEDRGYTVTYHENDNVSFSFIIDKEDSKNIRILSQNLDSPEFIFEGTNSRSNRIFGEGKIYLNNNLYYTGQINYNLFPQYVHENNINNRLIFDVVSKRFKLSQEIQEDELININQRREGPFEGQVIKPTHHHPLTKCITLNRQGWICDHCNKSFNNYRYTCYCSVCDFDFCGTNCKEPNKNERVREPHYDNAFHYKTLQHEHPLVKIKLCETNHQFKCFSCLKYIPSTNSLYYCTKCDFRLCLACQITESRGKEWQFNSSWHEHPLTFCKTKGYKKNNAKIYNTDQVEILENSDFFFTCNHCGIEYSRKKDSFYCTACDFYICMKCYKNYFFYNGRETENAINVNNGNKEVYPVYCRCYLNDKEKVRCNKCYTELNLNKWTFYCSNCNSNFCNYCYSSHKIIFNNNIMIFDGYFSNNRKEGFGLTYKINNELNYKSLWINGINELIRDIPHSHQFTRNNFNEDIQCDICLKLCDSAETGISCRQCDFDICDKCIIFINKIFFKYNYINFNNISIEKFPNYSKCDYCRREKKKVFFVVNKTIEILKKLYIFSFNFIYKDSNKYCLSCLKTCGKNKMKESIIHFLNN